MAGMGSTERAKTHSALSSPSRVALLQELRAADGPVDAHQLAASCDLHVTTVRFHLTALVEAGLVDTDRAPAVGRGRPRLLYRPVSRFDTGQADDPYLQIARVLAEAWNQDLPGDPAERAVEAGHRWARAALPDDPPGTDDPPDQTRVARAVNALFTEIGFEPAIRSADEKVADARDEAVLDLYACPFAALAEDHPGLICNVHLGLLRGTLEQLGAEDLRAELVPWSAPDNCCARIRRRRDGDLDAPIRREPDRDEKPVDRPGG